MAAWQCPRFTLSSNASRVGGNDANFGALESFPAFFFVQL
jgi:hypothetical protein